jgi:MFS family permease
VSFLVVLYASSFIDRVILGLLVEFMKHDLRISDTKFSVLAGFSFAIMYALAGIPMGWIVDKGSRRVLIACGCAIWSLMTVMSGLANNYWSLFGARIGVGFSEATLSPSSYSLLSDLFPRQKLSRALSIFTLGVPLGSGLALLAGGSVVALVTKLSLHNVFMGSLHPWQLVFIAIGLPGFILAALTLFVIREPPRSNIVPMGTDRSEVPTLRATFRYLWQRRSVYFGLIFGVSLAASFSFGASAWMPAVLIRVHGFTAPQAGAFLGTSILILGVLGCIASGVLADFFIRRGRADAHLLVSKIYVCGLFICGTLGPIIELRWLSLILIAGLGFFSFTWTGVPTALLQILTPNRMRGKTSGIYLFLITLVGQGIGPTAVALTTDYVFGDPKWVGRSLAIVGVIVLGLSYLCLHRAAQAVRRVELVPDGGAPNVV